MTLSTTEVERFVRDGFVKVEGAFSMEAAAAWREKLWAEAKLSPDDPSTWPPVVRLPGYGEPPHARAFNTPRLHEAFDQLAGADRWIAPAGIGTFVLRFPVPGEVNDDGWHIDVSFPGPNSGPTDFLTWRANSASRDRLGLVLLLFTDVGLDDAPTRIRIGSHLPTARRLATYGEAGESLINLGRAGFGESAHLPEALAIGEAGTAYICHPFLVHAAQKNLGARPRFLAQPPLQPKPNGQVQLQRAAGDYSPVERAIRLALSL
ncbi:MAG TPA: hypothetical protein VG942_10995 [Hyphomonadaceae bacterium]|nr:hypothetical protein [Hyphomonadaceae bacterium]